MTRIRSGTACVVTCRCRGPGKNGGAVLEQLQATVERAAAQQVEGDVDLEWRRLVRLAALGQVDLVEAERLEARDPDPDAWVRALTVRTAQPDPAAKSAAQA